MTSSAEEKWLSGDAYDAHRAEDFARFCDAAQMDLTAHVPTCPEWDVTALCDHLARVYQGRGLVVTTGAFPDRADFELRPEGDDPIVWVRHWSDELDRALHGRPDEAQTVTFMPGSTAMHFWRRRMALETLVHRTDAEISVGVVGSMDDSLSADGVAELLWFVTHPEEDHADGIPGISVVELTDGTRSWAVSLSDGAVGAPAPGAPADAVVRGSAPALLLALSGRDLEGLGAARFGVAPLGVEGDPAAFQRLLARLGGF